MRAQLVLLNLIFFSWIEKLLNFNKKSTLLKKNMKEIFQNSSLSKTLFFANFI